MNLRRLQEHAVDIGAGDVTRLAMDLYAFRREGQTAEDVHARLGAAILATERVLRDLRWLRERLSWNT